MKVNQVLKYLNEGNAHTNAILFMSIPKEFLVNCQF